MKTMTRLFLLFSLMGTILADLSINNPVEGTAWTAGQPATITWIPVGNGFTSNPQPVHLMRGNPEALTLVADLGSVPESQGSFQFTPPANMTAGNDYVVRVGGMYSHSFTISAASPSSSTPSSNTVAANNTETAGSSNSSAAANTTTPNTTTTTSGNTTNATNSSNGTTETTSSATTVAGIEGWMTAGVLLMMVSQQLY